MKKVLHLIQWFSLGGAGRAAISTAKYTSELGEYQHRAASLLPAEEEAVEFARTQGIVDVVSHDRDAIKRAIAQSDIVHIHWWNSPQMNEFLRMDLPDCRILAWFHVGGHTRPQIITDKLVEYVDFALACSPYTYECPAIQKLSPEVKKAKTGLAYGAADFGRLADLQPKEHSGFNIGYIGSVDFIKMHRDFVPMSLKADIPDAKFIVCGGGGALETVKEAVVRQGGKDRFDVMGYTDDIKSVLEILDLYGYPLCEDTYGASEINLQEVMYAGIVPVVFPYGGVKRLIEHNETGYVVHSPNEYSEALEYLYHHPEERKRIGENARIYAKETFPAQKACQIIHEVYERMLERPKRKHAWGVNIAEVLIDPSVAREAVFGKEEQLSPAEMFIDSLGEQAEEFRISLESEVAEDVLRAEEKIANLTDLMRDGGLANYRNYYPHDPYLRLWTGLAYYGSRQFEKAVLEFSEAMSRGLVDWRIAWYLSLSAYKWDHKDLARNALEETVKAVSDYPPASLLLEYLDGQKVVLKDNQLLNPDVLFEFRCPSFTRSGFKRLASIVHSLDICCYWDDFDYMWEKSGEGFRIRPEPLAWLGGWIPDLDRCTEVQFSEPVGICLSHMMTRGVFTGRSIRMVRDGRDAVRSHYLRYKIGFGEKAQHTLEDGLETPLLRGQGSIFQLGPLEEWFLQEKLLEDLVPQDQVFFIYFEQLKDNDVDAVSKMLNFMGLSRKREDILEALKMSQREQFKKQANDSHGASGMWKDGTMEKLRQRFNSLGSSLRIQHPYQFEESGEPSILDRAWLRASGLWIEKILKLIVKRFGDLPGEMLPFGRSLEKFCRHVKEIPLLQVTFSDLLLSNDQEREFAVEKLTALSVNGCLFIKLASLAVLEKHFPHDGAFSADYETLLSGLQTKEVKEGGYIDQKEYYLEALKDAGFLE